MQLDELRKKFEAMGHCVSVRDDVDKDAAAWFLGVSVGTLANWRCKNSKTNGPAYIDTKAGVRYPLVGLCNWLEDRMRTRAA